MARIAKLSLKTSVKTAEIVEVDPMQALAFELFELDSWKRSPEIAGRLRRHEELRNLLKLPFQNGRNAPFSGDGWQLFFTEQQGKSKPVCHLASECGNSGVRNKPEWHLTAQTMIKATPQ